jgi:hypothetical protein
MPVAEQAAIFVRVPCRLAAVPFDLVVRGSGGDP